MKATIIEDKVPIEPLLDFKVLCRRIICCWKKSQRQLDYDAVMENINADLVNSLDVANMLRRFRSHGFALSLLLDSKVIKLI
jgi:hypothetical protein